MEVETRRLATELYHTLCKMSVEDLQEFREEIMKDLASFNHPEWTIEFIDVLIDLVFQKKQEKAREAI